MRTNTLLEQRNMEHRMDARVRWQLELICNSTNAFENLKRSKVLGTQFQIGVYSCGLLFIWVKLQEDHISHLEFPLVALEVSKLLDPVLSFDEMLPKLVQN